uniref:Uncharacterized protein n=1 Tax=Prolemur simus TaxID=1328070 RepID=A0A8C9ANX7_PROSS
MGFITVRLSWVISNVTVDFCGQTTLDFPLNFPVKKGRLTKKHFTCVFPLGISAAALPLSGAGMFRFETCLIKQRSRVTPMAVASTSEEQG